MQEALQARIALHPSGEIMKLSRYCPWKARSEAPWPKRASPALAPLAASALLSRAGCIACVQQDHLFELEAEEGGKHPLPKYCLYADQSKAWCVQPRAARFPLHVVCLRRPQPVSQPTHAASQAGAGHSPEPDVV